MHVNEVTDVTIGSAITVHSCLGPGLLESVYRRCLAYELRSRGLDVVEELPIALTYGNLHDPCAFRADLFVHDVIVVEIKAKTTIHPIDKSQTLSHLRLMNLNVGLLINFHEAKLVDGLHRIVNRYQGPRPSD